MPIPDGVYWIRVNGGDWLLTQFAADQLIADFNAAFLDLTWHFDWRARLHYESFAIGDDLTAEILRKSAIPWHIDAEVRAQSNPSLN